MPARLVVIAGPGPDLGRVFALVPGQTLVVGRGRASQTHLTDASVSRLHCEVRFDGKRAAIRNVSDNGTRVNGQPIDQSELRPSDIVRIGVTELQFFNDDAPSEEMTLRPSPAPMRNVQVAFAATTEPELTLDSLRPDQRIGDYVLQAALHRSMRLAVFRAVHQRGQRPVALTILSPDLLSDAHRRHRFRTALQHLRGLGHQHLTPVRDAGQDNLFLWVATDLIEGPSLSSLVAAGAIDWQEGCRFAQHVAAALEYLHGQNLLHRNVSPTSVLIRSEDRAALLSGLLDLRPLSEAVNDAWPDPEMLSSGFLAPEAATRPLLIDARADLYSLGALLVFVLTGRPPGAGVELSNDLPGSLCSLIEELLATDPAERLASASEVRQRLQRYSGTAVIARLSPTETISAPGEPPPSAAYPFLAPPFEPDEIGRLSHYRILRRLGEGGMGIVFAAEDVHLHRPVALKVMKPTLAIDSDARQRFLREARAAAAVRSDHVVTVYQVGQDRDVPFLAMEYLEGQTLEAWLENGHEPTLAQILQIGLETAEGLAAAHARGLIHRDIKPANLWLEMSSQRADSEANTSPVAAEPSPGEFRVKILDFGLARQANTQSSGLTAMGLVVGTPAFMSPEQAQGATVDHRADLFSLGCVLYRLVTGQVPFEGETTLAQLGALIRDDPKPVRDLKPDAPLSLVTLIGQLLAKDPSDRPASAEEVARRIRTLSQSSAT